MNRPVCLIGSLNVAKKFIDKKINLEEYESLILEEDLNIEQIREFCYFLNKKTINKKVGIIYCYNKLNNAKQSVLLKIFESLQEDVFVFIHSYITVSFVINTRCEVIYLEYEKEIQKDLNWIMEYFLSLIKNCEFNKKQSDGIKIYLDTLHLFKIGLLNEFDKDCILNDIKGVECH